MQFLRLFRPVLAVVVGLGMVTFTFADPPANQPNVLMIAIDDLNDWIGCLGGHPQTLTPNLDRLAASGVLFTNAHCAAPACNPSRTAILTGRSPHRSGLYDNRQPMREVLPHAEIMPKVFSRHGYHSAGSGKLLHYFIDAPSWDDYFPQASTENPLPRTLEPATRPLSLPRGGPWQYVETDWGPLKATDDEYGGDQLVTAWISNQLSQSQPKPFFLACGIYRPHEPWFVPEKYFEPFPLETIQLPPGYKADDLDDLPPEGKRRGPNLYFAHIQEQGQWKQAIQSYLASIYFADAMLGRVIDTLEKGPNAQNTIVALWSDHGWHLGEKQHWQKYTAWRACTRVPLIVRVPPNTPGMPSGTQSARCDKPVNLVSLFPTLLELSGLPAEPHHDGPSLVPLLNDPKADWPHVSTTYLADPGSFGVSAERWRYIHYANGDEELYDIQSDPHEWNNLATAPEHAIQLMELRGKSPKKFAPKPAPSLASLPRLPWHPVSDQAVPPSKPVGNPFDVVFNNELQRTVRLVWMTPDGQKKSYGDIETGKQLRQQTRPGAVWLITDNSDTRLGHFVVDDRTAQAIIPKDSKATIKSPAAVGEAGSDKEVDDAILDLRSMGGFVREFHPRDAEEHWIQIILEGDSKKAGFAFEKLPNAPKDPSFDDDAMEIVRVLCLSGRAHVHLRHCQFTEAGLAQLAGTKVERLELTGSNINDQHLESLPKMMEMRELSIENSSITEAGFDSLSKCTQLESLNFERHPNISTPTSALLARLPKLKNISLNLTREDVEHLNKFEQLENLSVQLNDANAVSAFGELRTLGPLHELTISGKLTTSELIVFVAKQSPKLEKWYLRDCQNMTPEAAIAISGLSGLKVLSLDSTNVTDEHVKLLMPLNKLTWLDLAHTAVTDESLKVIGKFSDMRFLGLSQTNVSDAGLANLRELHNLFHLDLQGTYVKSVPDWLQSRERLQVSFDAPKTIGGPQKQAAKEKSSLDRAVDEFNKQAGKNAIGKFEPPLTSDEVVAAIRGWDRASVPIDDEKFALFEQIAATGQLPIGATLSSTTDWRTREYNYRVWWIDLTVMTDVNRLYTFRIRSRILSSQKLDR